MGNACFEGAQQALPAPAGAGAAFKASNVLEFTLNGKKVVIQNPDPRQMLLEYLRNEAYLTGAKRSCLQGGCGACTVNLQYYHHGIQQWVSRGVNACLKPLVSCDGFTIVTVEGIGTERSGLHAIQERVAGTHAFQCGFCTPGMVMNMYALMKANGKPTAQSCLEAFDGSICRCTGYRNLCNVSESFAADASAACQEIAKKFQPGFNADMEKLGQFGEAPPRRTAKAFTAEDTTWYAPTSLAEVFAIKATKPRAVVVLGDTAKGMRQSAYETFGGKNTDIIYMFNVAELGTVKEEGGNLVVGAGLTIQQLCNAIDARKDKFAYASDLVAALTNVAQRHVRREAGWAGNIVLTKTGFPSDLVPALIAADASVSYLTDSAAETTVSIADFRPGKVPANAIITKLHVPLRSSGTYRYYRVAHRKWLCTAWVNSAFRIDVDAAKTITDARIVVGVYAQGPKRSAMAEKALVGSKLTSDTFQKAIAGLHQELDAEFSCESQYLTVDNPQGKEAFRKTLPDRFLFKFFQEAQKIHGVQTAKDTELGVLKPQPLKRGVLKFEELKGREDTAQIQAKACATGSMDYTDDINMACYRGYLVVTKCNTGKLVKIDASEALKVEGVKGVITAKDIPGANSTGFVPGEEPLFVPEGGDIITTGQQVAVVVADTYRTAKKAADKVKLTIENENAGAILTIDDAIEKESFLAGAKHTPVGVGKEQALEAVKRSDNIIEGSTYIIGQHAFALEKQAAFAIPRDCGGMLLYSSTQSPDFCRAVVAGQLGLHGRGSFLTVKCTRAGGAFGPKNSRNVPIAGAAAVAAHALEFPVKINLEATQEHSTLGGRHAFKVNYKIGYKSDGTIQGCHVEAWGNGGCTHDFSGFLFLEYAESVPSVYGWGGNFHMDCWGMKTNLPSNTAVRSFGNPQGMFTTEAMIEHVAMATGKGAEEIRERNLLTKANAVTPWKQAMEFFNADMLYQKVKADAGYNTALREVEDFNRQNRWRKRGVSVVPICYGHSYIYAAGTGALVNINGSDGSVLVHHGGVEIGQGINIKVAQVVALTLGCDLSKVRVAECSTDTVPNSRFTGGSITSEVCCESARRACLDLNQTLEPHRKFLREKNAADPEKKSNPEPAWEEVVAAANSVLAHQEKLSATGIFAPTNNKYTTDVQGNANGKPFHGDYFTFGAALSLVELDVLTGQTSIIKSHILFDVGQSINPGIDIAQIEGAFAWGIGYYLHEEPLWDAKGQDRTQGVWEYKPPMASEMPQELYCELLRDNPYPKGILGSKAVGEPPFMLAYSVAGAIKMAIASARKDAGAAPTYNLPMPMTADAVAMACATTTAQMKC